MKSIACGSVHKDFIEGTDGTVVWGADESAFFYLTMVTTNYY